MSGSSFRSLGQPLIPESQSFFDRVARCCEFHEFALEGREDLSPGFAHMFARRPTGLANSQKRSHLFQ